MTDSSRLPLQIKHDPFPHTMLEAIRRVDQTATRQQMQYFLAGATARELLLHHVFGCPSGRRTLDVDFGIAVSNWSHFERFRAALIKEAGFVSSEREMQRFVTSSDPPVRVDLVPFGGVELPDHTIAWPPDQDIVIRVAGFEEAFASAVVVRLDDRLIIKVVSLPALMILKLIAWTDRKYENRDAPDIYTLLSQYGDAGNEERLYSDEVATLEAEGYDFELAGARLMGADAAQIVSIDTREQVSIILKSDTLMEQLINQIAVHREAEHFERCQRIVTKFRDAFLAER